MHTENHFPHWRWDIGIELGVSVIPLFDCMSKNSVKFELLFMSVRVRVTILNAMFKSVWSQNSNDNLLSLSFLTSCSERIAFANMNINIHATFFFPLVSMPYRHYCLRERKDIPLLRFNRAEFLLSFFSLFFLSSRLYIGIVYACYSIEWRRKETYRIVCVCSHFSTSLSPHRALTYICWCYTIGSFQWNGV